MSESDSKSSKKPVHRIRYGRVNAAIWENKTERGTMFNVSVQRSYQDDNRSWTNSHFFGVGDLPVAAKLLLDAHTWISARQSQERGSNDRGGAERAKGANRRQSANV